MSGYGYGGGDYSGVTAGAVGQYGGYIPLGGSGSAFNWGSMIPGMGGILGGIVGMGNNNSAINHASASSNAALGQVSAAEQQAYDRAQGNLNPWILAGQGALANLQKANGGDFSAFMNSPDYLYALQSGMKGLDRGAASRGMLFTGANQADEMALAQGLASKNYNNWWQHNFGLSGQGLQGAGDLSNIAASTANNLANAYMWNAQNQMQSAYNKGSSKNSGFGSILGGIGSILGAIL